MTISRFQALLLALGLMLVGIAIARADGPVDDSTGRALSLASIITFRAQPRCPGTPRRPKAAPDERSSSDGRTKAVYLVVLTRELFWPRCGFVRLDTRGGTPGLAQDRRRA